MTPVIRPAVPTDAAALITYVQELAAEPEIDILFEPGEFQFTVEQEAEFLRGFTESENAIFLVAELGGQIVGCLSAEGGRLRSLRHVVSLGISVQRHYRNQGIGKLLMAAALDWAAATGIVQRIELQVIVRNLRAIHLYRSFGFEIEGTKRNAVCRLGKMYDVHLMAKLLE
jgi:RimJ/RimL family protein N-acetyltransferase